MITKRSFGLNLLFNVILLFTIVRSQSVDDNPYPYDNDTDYGSHYSSGGRVDPYTPSDSPDVIDPLNVPWQEETLTEKLDFYRESLDELFGSPEKVQKQVFDGILSEDASYWILDEAYLSIEKELQRKHAGVQEELRGIVDNVLGEIRGEMNVIRHRNNRARDYFFFETLDKFRSVIDCAIGRSRRNWNFNAVERSFTRQSWQCRDSIPQFWWDLVNVDYSNKSCTLENTLEALIEIEEVGKRKYVKELVPETELKKIKLELLLTLSKKDNLEYLWPFLCKQTAPPNQPQHPVCDTYIEVLCERFEYRVVTKITKMIDDGTVLQIPFSPDDMFILLSVQQSLGSVTGKMTNVNSVRSNDAAPLAAEDMLMSFMGIIDTAIGNRSIGTWRETESNRTREQFQRILLDNENYIGSASELVLSRSRDHQLNKETLSLHMKRISSLTDANEGVNFSFGNAHIWTENLTNSLLNATDLKMYAIYYKSWHDMLNRILGEVGLQESSITTTSENPAETYDKYFVGDGGIVSLSTRSEMMKTSIPVSYKISFDDDSTFIDENGAIARRCLSCGFLDVTTGRWLVDGCTVTSVDDVGVTCHCNHTTNFAAFMSPHKNEYDITEEQELWLNILEYVGSVTSMIGLLLSFVAFCIVRHTVRNDRLRAHMNLAIALLFVHMIQLGADSAVFNNSLCVIVTLSTHYFLLAAFMWMLVEGIFLYFYVVQVFMLAKIENRHWMYMIGWLTPAFIVAIAAGYGLPNDVYIQKAPQPPFCQEGEMLFPPLNSIDEGLHYSACWLDTDSGMIWSFIGPALAVITFNMLILGKVVMVLIKLSKRKKGMKNFQATNQAYPNYSLQNKQRKSLQLKAFATDLTSSDRPSSIVSDDPSLHSESLHGHVITHSGKSASRSNSRTYSQQHNLYRSRAPTYGNSNEGTFLKDAKTAAKGAAVLLPLLGIPWIFGTLGYKSYALTIVFVLLNSLQGVAIFLVYCVFNGEVRRALYRHREIYKLGRYNNTRVRASSTSSGKFTGRSLLRHWRRRSTAISTLSGSANNI